MSKHIVVIGAVALGPKAACRARRLDPEAKVTMIDKSGVISYGGCGIPYFVSGDVADVSQLTTTSFHMVRDAQFFKDTKGVDVLTRTEAMSIDRKQKTVRIRRLESGLEEELPYDKLLIATGAAPRTLHISGDDLPGAHYVGNLEDAEAIKAAVSKGGISRAVIVGAGFIGLEMAEALADMWDVETTVVEIADQALPRMVSPALAAMARRHMEEKGVSFRFGASVSRIEGDGRVERVMVGEEILAADMIILAAGVVPQSGLAREAGLDVSARGGIIVDAAMRTSDPDIYAGGDCVEIRHLATGEPFYLPLGSMANRQGRVIGTNLVGPEGNEASFDGAVGSFAVKLFERTAAGAGLTLDSARQAGFDAVSVLLFQLDRAHFFPDKALLAMEMTVDRKSRKVLGFQGFGAAGDALVGRVGAVAALMCKHGVVEDVCQLEYPYSPPYSSAMDVVNNVGNLADNVLAGLNEGVGPLEFMRLWEQREAGECVFLDCRESANAEGMLARHPNAWKNIPQGRILERLDDIPRDKPLILICNTGGRSFEAMISLKGKGFDKVMNLHGGMAGLTFCGWEESLAGATVLRLA